MISEIYHWVLPLTFTFSSMVMKWWISAAISSQQVHRAHDPEVKAGMAVLAAAKAGVVARAGTAVPATAVQAVCGTSFSAQQAEGESIDE
jgi:hypothetical protein